MWELWHIIDHRQLHYTVHSSTKFPLHPLAPPLSALTCYTEEPGHRCFNREIVGKIYANFNDPEFAHSSRIIFFSKWANLSVGSITLIVPNGVQLEEPRPGEMYYRVVLVMSIAVHQVVCGVLLVWGNQCNVTSGLLLGSTPDWLQ